MKTINWGIIATGGIAQTFATALNSVDGVCIKAVASRTTDKAKAFADKFHVEKAYGSYDELIQDDEVDVVYIATPTSSHYKDMLACLNGGKSVLCEKTVTLTTEEWGECVALAKSKGLFLMEAMWMKFQPLFRHIHSWVNKGVVGNIKMVKAEFFSTIPYDKEGRMYNKALGGGGLYDLGVYSLSFVTSFLGTKPKTIHKKVYMGETGVDYNASFLLGYEGAYGQADCGFNIPSQNPANIIGTKGRITIEGWFFCATKAKLFDLNNNLVEEVELPFNCNGYEYEIHEVNRCLRLGLKESDIVPLSDTLDILKIITAPLN